VVKIEELATSRAAAVRDALKAAGVPEAITETKAPMSPGVPISLADGLRSR
jgi:hypothetical protein